MTVHPDLTVLSPNFYRGWPNGTPKAVEIHATRGSNFRLTDQEETQATINWFMREGNPSSHWIINGSGKKIRIVSDENRAWHSGIHNGSAWGIELTQPTIDRPFTDKHYEGLVEVVGPYIERGVPIVRVPGVFQNGDKGFTGHEDTAQGRSVGKTDPGPEFDWPRFIQMLEDGGIDCMECLDELERYRQQQRTINNAQNTILISIHEAVGGLEGFSEATRKGLGWVLAALQDHAKHPMSGGEAVQAAIRELQVSYVEMGERSGKIEKALRTAGEALKVVNDTD